MKTCSLAVAAVLLILLSANPALAQATGGTGAGSVPLLGASFGAGLVILGAGVGLGKIGAAALEGMARQPEAAGKIQPAMIIIAALLEGVTFFALLICIIRN